jgi:hypothetical protein
MQLHSQLTTAKRAVNLATRTSALSVVRLKGAGQVLPTATLFLLGVALLGPGGFGLVNDTALKDSVGREVARQS